ncbi:MAG: MerR family transcriptional regulator [Planctomycetota bacterium]|nr:MAG: MerR family transcriptional regulator [Planctomycetota bacterium]
MASASSALDIADLARLAGVSSRTIRYYGELGLIRPEARGAGGRRLYGPDALQRLRFISRLKNLGLTLEEIGQLNRAFDRGATPRMLEQLDRLLGQRLEEIAARIAELEKLAEELRSYRAHTRRKLSRTRSS